jgi:hypothetical protein
VKSVGRFLTALAAVWLSAMPSATLAQDTSGKPEQVQVDKSRKYKENLARCVIGGGGASFARGLILHGLDKRAAWLGAHRLIQWECPASELGMSSDWQKIEGPEFLYAIAPTLVRADSTSLKTVDFMTVPPLTHLDPGTDPQDQRIAALSRFGECVNRADARRVYALLASRVATPAETTAMAALSPLLGPCLTAGEVRLNRDELRGVLALNFYRLVGAPKGKRVDMPKLDS